ncbi:hypothetical protein K438DRAFT_1910256 [Mycena galopus ATCC 62051]|nr:hypothetical protein K438DRAFT_1910256 [Mycena galopus ATCC 62051]
MQRPLISYDDITLPYQPDFALLHLPADNSPAGPSQSKKRKWSKQTNKNGKGAGAGVAAEQAGDEEEDVDSRWLTQEERWDDSALIDAWDAATEEYEALNGPDKGWKTDPVHKSPLWYNVPPTKPPNKKMKVEAEVDTAAGPSHVGVGAEEGDSKPLDFDTFVPKHDAALGVGEPSAGASANVGYAFSAGIPVPPPGVAVASQDEAFTRALEAMYWGGYWTAVYHCHRAAEKTEGDAGEEEVEGEGEGGEDGEEEEDLDDAGEYDEGAEEEEAFVSTQR